MVIVKLNIAHFGKLKDRTITLRPGMNVITGENESGKSTIAAFIRSMLFGASYEEVRKYEPYDKDGVFGGKMRILVSGAFYEIERSFLKDAEHLQIVKESDETIVEEPQQFLNEAMNGISLSDYDETGFTAQYFFLQDIQRLKETPEKRQNLEREKSISEKLHAAEDKIRERYDETEAKLSVVNLGEADAIRTRLGETTDEIDRLDREYPEVLKTLQKMRESSRQQAERKNEDRRNAEEALHSDMIERKQELEFHTREESGKIRKNALGTLLMTLALLLSAADYFYICSEKITLSFEKSCYPVLGVFAGAFLMFAAGIIITAAVSARNMRILKANEQGERYRKNADEAEERYRKYMKEQQEESGQSSADSLNEEKIRELTRRAEEMQTELKLHYENKNRLTEEKQQIETKVYENPEVRRELEVLKIVLRAFEDTEIDEKKNEAFSEAASRYLNSLDPRKESRVRADGGFITVESDTGVFSLEELSLSAATEVLLASRLARLEEKDEKKMIPIVLDDVLSGLDSERVKNCMNVLRTLGRQVILLSCQQRERKAL